MDSGRNETANVSATMRQVLEGAGRILGLPAGKCLSNRSYMELDHLLFKFTSNILPDDFKHASENISKKTREELKDKRCRELYARLSDLTIEHLRTLFKEGKDLEGESLLSEYVEHWTRFQASVKTLNQLLRNLNQHWVKWSLDNGKTDVCAIVDLCLVLWREVVQRSLAPKLYGATYSCVEKARNGENVDPRLVSETLLSFIKLGVSKGGSRGNTLEIYQESFESHFLKDTELFYAQLSNRCSDVGQNSNYVQNVDKWMNLETCGMAQFVHASTLKKLEVVCVKVLIEDHLQRFFSEFQTLMKENKIQCLSRVLKLVSMVDGALENLNGLFKGFIYSDGESMLNTLGESAMKDPRIYIHSILDLNRKYENVVTSVFENHVTSKRAFYLAFEKLLCYNIAKSSRKPFELLSQYCDILLKKNHEIDFACSSIMSASLDKVMVVFKYLEDKDEFLAGYELLMSLRLVGQTSVGGEAELMMIHKLRNQCGPEYTRNLEAILEDFTAAPDLDGDFRHFLTSTNQLLPIELGVKILRHGIWPFKLDGEILLPPPLKQSMEKFEQFYAGHQKGRKLHWLFKMSKGCLKANYGKSTYYFELSTYQLTILLHFNNSDSHSLKNLQEHTQIEMNALIQALQNLIKGNVLLLKTKQIGPSSVLSLNKSYSNKKVSVTLCGPCKTSFKKEEAKARVENDRRFEIQATIVRILKKKRQMPHQELLREVNKQLASRFSPKTTQVNKSLDKLVDRFFIRIDPNAPDVFQYIA